MSVLPDTVKRLIADHIDSVSQLETLLLLAREQGQQWTTARVVRQLRTQPGLAEAALAKFARAGLAAVEVDEHGTPSFRYAPASRHLADTVHSLSELYASRRTTVIATVFETPRDSLQDFADSFRLRGERGGPPASSGS
jgi:hypothetical protein